MKKKSKILYLNYVTPSISYSVPNKGGSEKFSMRYKGDTTNKRGVGGAKQFGCFKGWWWSISFN